MPLEWPTLFEQKKFDSFESPILLFDDEVEKAESLESPILFDDEQKFESFGVKLSELDDWGDEKEVIEDSGGGGVDGSLSTLFNSMFGWDSILFSILFSMFFVGVSLLSGLRQVMEVPSSSSLRSVFWGSGEKGRKLGRQITPTSIGGFVDVFSVKFEFSVKSDFVGHSWPLSNLLLWKGWKVEKQIIWPQVITLRGSHWGTFFNSLLYWFCKNLQYDEP